MNGRWNSKAFIDGSGICVGMKSKDGFRDFAMKRFDFAGFTSCENFKSYCRPILRGVKEMGKKKIWSSLFIFWFFPILVNEEVNVQREIEAK